MALPTSTITKSIILVSPADWDEWIHFVRMKANRTGIGAYTDFTATTEPPEPVKPVIPSYSDVKSGAIKASDLNENEKMEFKVKREDYKLELTDYKEKADALKSLEDFIISSIDRAHVMHLVGKETVYQKLNALRTRLAPTDRVRKMEIIRKYRELQRAPKLQNITQWIID